MDDLELISNDPQVHFSAKDRVLAQARIYFAEKEKEADMEDIDIIETHAWRLGKGASQEDLLESFRETDEEIGCFCF